MIKDDVFFTELGKELKNKTNHGIGFKKVLFNGEFSTSSITQVAVGELHKEVIPVHNHSTMEEYYFFLEGEGQFSIGSTCINCKKGTFLIISPNVFHSLKTNEFVRFLYWGVSI